AARLFEGARKPLYFLVGRSVETLQNSFCSVSSSTAFSATWNGPKLVIHCLCLNQWLKIDAMTNADVIASTTATQKRTSRDANSTRLWSKIASTKPGFRL